MRLMTQVEGLDLLTVWTEGHLLQCPLTDALRVKVQPIFLPETLWTQLPEGILLVLGLESRVSDVTALPFHRPTATWKLVAVGGPSSSAARTAVSTSRGRGKSTKWYGCPLKQLDRATSSARTSFRGPQSLSCKPKADR